MSLNTPFTLPNGSILKNRLAKSAMSENLGDKNHAPSKLIFQAYDTWIKGGAGLIITGNVMIDQRALGEPQNVVVEDKRNFEALKTWAATAKGTGTHLWPQINHPGRQAIGAINKEVVGPSAIPIKIKYASGAFKTPRPMTEDEIWNAIDRFGNTAQIMQAAGFTGVQIHGAHGYLISQFLSPLANIRKDKWGGSLENRARFVIEVYKNIRQKVGADFPVGIKINSADFQRGGFTEEESMEVVKILSAEKMDLIEISGGTYEKASMIGDGQKKSTIEREAYFLDYIEKVRKITKTPLMLTGGFRTKSVMENAIAQDKLDVVGMARPFAVFPNLANDLLEGKLDKIGTLRPSFSIKSLNNQSWLEMMWYGLQIKNIGEGKIPDPKLGLFKVFSHNIGVTLKKLIRG